MIHGLVVLTATLKMVLRGGTRRRTQWPLCKSCTLARSLNPPRAVIPNHFCAGAQPACKEGALRGGAAGGAVEPGAARWMLRCRLPTDSAHPCADPLLRPHRIPCIRHVPHLLCNMPCSACCWDVIPRGKLGTAGMMLGGHMACRILGSWGHCVSRWDWETGSLGGLMRA